MFEELDEIKSLLRDAPPENVLFYHTKRFVSAVREYRYYYIDRAISTDTFYNNSHYVAYYFMHGRVIVGIYVKRVLIFPETRITGMAARLPDRVAAAINENARRIAEGNYSSAEMVNYAQL